MHGCFGKACTRRTDEITVKIMPTIFMDLHHLYSIICTCLEGSDLQDMNYLHMRAHGRAVAINKVWSCCRERARGLKTQPILI